MNCTASALQIETMLWLDWPWPLASNFEAHSAGKWAILEHDGNDWNIIAAN